MSKENRVFLNEEIRAEELRCVGADGEAFGVLSKSEALSLAAKLGVDLVLIAPDANPPVCKLMDYNKFRYQQDKRQKEAKKKQKTIEVKEIKFSVRIAQNDIDYKVKHAQEFLEDGKHVKFRVFLRGREQATPALGVAILQKVLSLVADFGEAKGEISTEGRYVNVLVVPKKK